jgi:methionine-rich copper-binding protein CopC
MWGDAKLSAINRLILALLLLVLGFCVSCSKSHPALTLAQVRSTTPFKATVEEVHLSDFRENGVVLLISLRKQDGSELRIMQVSATTQDVAAAQSLVKGQLYDFPKVFTDPSLGRSTTP